MCVVYIAINNTYKVVLTVPTPIIIRKHNGMSNIFFLLALKPPLGVVFYSPLVGFSLLACEVS